MTARRNDEDWARLASARPRLGYPTTPWEVLRYLLSRTDTRKPAGLAIASYGVVRYDPLQTPSSCCSPAFP